MAYSIRREDITSKPQLKREMILVSKKNPGRIVVAYGRFGIIDFDILDRQPSTDTAASSQTYKEFGGFFKNGRIIKPSKTWLRKFHSKPRLG